MTSPVRVFVSGCVLSVLLLAPAAGFAQTSSTGTPVPAASSSGSDPVPSTALTPPASPAPTYAPSTPASPAPAYAPSTPASPAPAYAPYPPPGYAYPPGYYPPPPGYPAPYAYPPGYPVPYGYPPGYYYPPPVPAKPRRPPSFFVGSLSGGLGVPYGILGGAINLGVDYLTVMAGAGTTVQAGVGYAIGGRAYFLDTSHRLRPHITVVWGTTAAYLVSGVGMSDMKGTLCGFGFFAGLDHDFGELGDFYATYGIGYITHEDLPASVATVLSQNGINSPDFGMPIKFMAAIGYRFGGQ